MSSVVVPASRHIAVASMVLASFAAGLEGMIVVTAIPSIISALGGFTHYTWISSAFLLTQSTAIIICGKLADVYGRRPVLMLGAILVLVGSILCGFAWSMSSLICFRLLQGLGAGATSPVMATIIGDMFPFEERARVLSIFGASGALASITGPIIGGLIVSHLSWSWAFWLGVPISVVAIVGMALFVDESVAPHGVKIDYGGAALLAGSISSLLLLLDNMESSSTEVTIMVTLFAACAVSLALHQRYAADPFIPFQLWKRRTVLLCNVATFTAGMALAAFCTVLPIYVQGLLTQTSTTVGFMFTAMVIGSVLGYTMPGRMQRAFWGISPFHLVSTLLPVGGMLLLAVGPDSDTGLLAAVAFLLGCGGAPLNVLGLALVQDAVEQSKRGSATASFAFTASLGITLGVVVAGALLKAGIAYRSDDMLVNKIHYLLDRPEGFLQLASDPRIRSSVEQGVHWAFLGIVVLIAVTFALTWLLPAQPRPISRADS